MESETVWIVEALIRLFAEKAAAAEGIPVEVAVEGAWSLFERGYLRLVEGPDDDRSGSSLAPTVPSGGPPGSRTSGWRSTGSASPGKCAKDTPNNN
jgi:hypothetical protein